MTTDSRGGGEFAAVDLLDGLVARGHEAVLLATAPDLAAGTAIRAQRLDLGPKLSRRSWRQIMLRWPRYVSRLRTALEREAPYDALLLHFKKEQLMSLRLSARLRSSLVWAEWGPLPEPMRRGLPGRMYQAAARRVALIIAVSDNTRDSLVDAGVESSKVVVVPNLLDTETLRFDAEARRRLRGEWGIDEQAFVVGCISRFHPHKRNDVLIDALDHLPDAVVVFAGDGEDEPVLRARAARFGERVRFFPTPRGYVQDVLSACDVQVFAAAPVEGSPRSIGFGQLTERPVIATARVGAVGEMIVPGTGAIIAPDNDPRALADCLAAYRDDPARRAKEGEAARKHAIERHGAESVLGLVERALEGAVAGARAPSSA